MNELEQTIAEYKGIQIGKKRLKRVEEQLNKQYAKLFDLDFRLEREFNDVKRLTKLSLYNLFHTVLGDKEQQYEIEKQEYLTAIMHYTECKNVVEILEFEQKILIDKIKSETKIVAKITLLSKRDFTLIEKKYPGAAFDLKFMIKQQEDNINYLREVREANGIALKVQILFEEMIAHLRKARRVESWGYTYVEKREMKKVKSSSLDKAHKLSYKIKPLLDNLHTELNDVYKEKSLTTERTFPEFDFFNDIYYDRLISDWIFQGRILSTITHLFGTLETIKSLLSSLRIEIEMTEKQMNYIDKRREEIIFEYIKDDLKK